MPIIRVHTRTGAFVIIDKTGLNDERLSWKAKGILSYLVSKPDDWQVIMGELCKRSTDGERSTRSGMQELRSFGYAHFGVKRSKSGKVIGTQWTIYETCDGRATETAVSPTSAKRQTAETPTSAKKHATKNDSLNKNDVQGLRAFLDRIGKLFGREPGFRINDREKTAWNKLTGTLDAEQVGLIERFHKSQRNAQRPPFPRQELLALMQNWQGELDKARGLFPKKVIQFKAAAPKAAAPKLSAAEEAENAATAKRLAAEFKRKMKAA